MRPKVYTISAYRPFLATLAAGLLGMAAGDPLALPRMIVLLPTRRAARALREAFLRVMADREPEAAPLLLPRMRAIGDLDSDELTLVDDAASAGDLTVPPAIPELRRRLLLTRLVLRWAERRGGEPLLPGQAVALARSLASLLDRAATEGADFERIDDLVPQDLAEHWQTVQRFLKILPQHWPQILAEEGALDPAQRRNRLIERQASVWRRGPPKHPVVAAGLVGGIPALTELLSAVATLEHGAVILPGLDRSRDTDEWSAIEQDPSHPQHLMADLLRALGVAPGEVPDWPPGVAALLPAPTPTLPRIAAEKRVEASPESQETGRRKPQEGRSASRSFRVEGAGELGDLPLFSWRYPVEHPLTRRMRLVSEAMRPAATTDGWRRLPSQPIDALNGISRYDCSSSQQEAVTVALLLRRKLETPGATAALVTPDRELARRVAAELRRWGIEIDDSAGVPLNRTPPGVFLRLVLELAESRVAPVPLLAALKHPLAAGGLETASFRALARRLERAIRGPRPAPGFAGLKAALSDESGGLQRFADRLQSCLGAFAELLTAEAAPLSHLVRLHVEAAERLAATATESGSERLWNAGAGEAAALFCHELIDGARDFPPLLGCHYPAVFEALTAGAVVRPEFGRHPRLAIWGLLEARLQQADLVVLGGLDEGIWPASAQHDPWMSRQMRREFGIAAPERAIGIAAHDFVQAMGAPEVALTRAARAEGAPTVPSRWLLRLDAVLSAAGLRSELRPDAEILDAATLIDRAEHHRPLPPPEPRPPVTARPRTLSVTQIETWLRDPYAIYARHVLGLKALDEPDADPSRAELGTVIHQTLEEFIRRFARRLPADAEAELLRIGRQKFGPMLTRPGAWAFWWPRFERIAHWLVSEERIRREAVTESFSECEGRLALNALGGPFTITARADRIDRLATGGFALIDYKTGSIPSAKTVEAGFAPQLPLEGAILRGGGFGSFRGPVAMLEYWRLSGGEPAGERRPLETGDPAALIDRVLARTEALINHFDDPSTPYLAVPSPRWAPRFSEYRHLERVTASEAEE